jgi:tight adherence protein C
MSLALSIIGVITAERRQVARSLAAVEAIRTAPAGMRRELERPFSQRVVTPTLRWFASMGRRLTPGDQAIRMRRQLDLAGNPTGWDVDRILALKAMLMLLGAVAGAVVLQVIGLAFLPTMVITIGLALLGYFAPNLALYQKGYNRNQQIQQDLADALDLMTISVEAGLAFDAAVAQVARNTTGPLAEEFFRVLSEMQIGRTRSDALRGLSERTTVPELHGFAGAMIQADEFGVPIASVLRVQAQEMRVKRRQRAEERAQKVPVKILFPLIFCILPALFVVILGPAVISIFRNLSGGFG